MEQVLYWLSVFGGVFGFGCFVWSLDMHRNAASSLDSLERYLVSEAKRRHHDANLDKTVSINNARKPLQPNTLPRQNETFSESKGAAPVPTAAVLTQRPIEQRSAPAPWPSVPQRPVLPPEPWEEAPSVEGLLRVASCLPLGKRADCENWVKHSDNRLGFESVHVYVPTPRGRQLRYLPLSEPVMVALWQPVDQGQTVVALAPLVGRQLVGDIPLVFGKLVEVTPEHADPSWIAHRVLQPGVFQVPDERWKAVLDKMHAGVVPDDFRKLYIHAEESSKRFCKLEANEPR